MPPSITVYIMDYTICIPKGFIKILTSFVSEEHTIKYRVSLVEMSALNFQYLKRETLNNTDLI
jgi:hypothetical protein